MLLYHGGTVFGQAENNPDSLAETVLGLMIVCLHGGPKFINKVIPVTKLNASYIYGQVNDLQKNIETAGGTLKAIICDGNRTNQAFFKKYQVSPDHPWVKEDGVYLLFDFVHLIKNIRNLWLTEKMGELSFDDNGTLRTAKWEVLRSLHEIESQSLVKMSTLNKVSVSPRPIERQRVSTCLQVFSERTVEALQHHPDLEKTQEVQDTAIFIKKILMWWKIVNVKEKGLDVRFRDPLRAVISDVGDERLEYLRDFGLMCLQMAGKQGKRVKQLSKDTAVAVHITCEGLVALAKDLLENHKYEYVCLGRFTKDPLEKEFGKLRQGSGGTYFINVQQIREKVNIKRTSLLLSQAGIEELETVDSGHKCGKCDYVLDEHSSEIFDNLPELEDEIPEHVKLSLVYIAGYTVRKQEPLAVESEDTSFYYERYGSYTDALNRGGLSIPGDSACQWVFLSYALFDVLKEHVCQFSLTEVLLAVSDFYKLHRNRKQCRCLANIFLKNLCLRKTPQSSKESGQKLLKLMA